MTAAPAAAPVVRISDAFCLYTLPSGAAVAALRGLTLEVSAGERVVVHGPNGSGKTTLLRVLAAERGLSAGSVWVAGRDLASASAGTLAAWRRACLGRVDQDPGRLLRPELDVGGNVALQMRLARVPAATARTTAMEALERSGIAHLAARRPGTLSGGEAQRVAVCAALAHRPALVLADEPTGELDAGSAREVYDTLAAATADAGAALVLVSHDRRAGRIADRVVRIRDGRLSETWHPDAAGGSSQGELLVVDDRGWVRLPQDLRQRIAATDELRATLADGGLLLQPTSPLHRIHQTGTPPPAPIKESSTIKEISAIKEDSGPLARLRDVHVGYGDHKILNGVTLDVTAGRLLAVSGPSGVGKSTLLRVLTGLQRPDSGQAFLGDVDLGMSDRAGLAAARARWTAVVTQQVRLAALDDAAGNLDLARAARDLPADPDAGLEQLDALGVAGLAGRSVGGLSGGEQQRVAVARAFSVQAPLVILDEPTSQLDEASAEQLVSVLTAAVRSGSAVVVATHDPVVLAAADDVLVL